MARNTIGYEGRVVDTDKMPIEFGKFKEGGMTVLKFTVAEQHSMKNAKAPKEFQDGAKAADAYVNTFTTWHKVTAFGEQAELIAQQDWFYHGSIIQLDDLSYTEEKPWKMRDGVERAGRPETVNNDRGGVSIKKKNDGEALVGRDPRPPVWDGLSPIPIIVSKGGGSAPEFVVADDEGF